MLGSDEQINILVVDDENFFAEWLAENLRDTSTRYQADWVTSGERALEFMERHPVDLVISDIKMEGISGIDLLTQIRRRHPGLGVILMTGYDLAELKQEAIKRGSLFYLEKPFSMERLQSTIEAALKNRPSTTHPAGTGAASTQLSLLDALHFLHFGRSHKTLRVTSPGAEGMIYYQDGEVIHAHCQELEGEEAFSEIMRWGSTDVAVLSEEPPPKRTIFRDFDSLVTAALEEPPAYRPVPAETAVTAQLSLLDALHLFHLSRSNKALLVKAADSEGTIYYRNGDIIHARCQAAVGAPAFTEIMSWGSNQYQVLSDEPIPDQTIFDDFDALINAALQPVQEPPVVTEPASDLLTRNLSLWNAQTGAPARWPALAPERRGAEEQPEAGAAPVLSGEGHQQLRELLAASDYLEGSALLTLSGDILASTLPPGLLTAAAVADVGALLGLCRQQTEQLDRGPHRRSLIQGERGHVIISEIGLGLFLLFVTPADAPLGLALFQVGERTEKVSEVAAQLVVDRSDSNLTKS